MRHYFLKMAIKNRSALFVFVLVAGMRLEAGNQWAKYVFLTFTTLQHA